MARLKTCEYYKSHWHISRRHKVCPDEPYSELTTRKGVPTPSTSLNGRREVRL